MENKQYPPRGGPPLVCRCRGIPYAFNADRSGDAIPELAGTGRFQVEAARADLSVPIAIGTTPDNVGRDSCCQNFRIEEDAGPPGRFQVPNLQGLGNLEGLRRGLTSRSRAREPAGHPPEAVCRSGTGTERARDGTMVRNPVVHSFAGIAVGFNQRTEKAHAGTGLQPHLFVMRLKPEELFCSIVPRQLKQTAMEEKQTAMAREAAGHPPEKVCRSGTGTERTGRRDGTMVHIRDDTGLHIRHGTDLGSRNAAASRPVHPPEWERCAEKRGKWRMMNNGINQVLFCLFNAVRSIEADRLANEVTATDLSVPIVPIAIGIGNNVGRMKKEKVRFDRFNADRSKDAVRFWDEATPADLTPSEQFENFEKN